MPSLLKKRKNISLRFFNACSKTGRSNWPAEANSWREVSMNRLHYIAKNSQKNQEEMDADAFDGFWFLTEECPGGIVWIHDSGYEDWT
ncbi:TPA: DUF596 domain-containing protein [Serratia marcescens]